MSRERGASALAPRAGEGRVCTSGGTVSLGCELDYWLVWLAIGALALEVSPCAGEHGAEVICRAAPRKA